MEEQLIELVKEHPFLFDRTQLSYRNTHLKEQTWAQIGKELKLPATKVKQRWVTLRDRFTREKKIISQLSGSDSCTSRREWRYYKHLDFLHDVVFPGTGTNQHNETANEISYPSEVSPCYEFVDFKEVIEEDFVDLEDDYSEPVISRKKIKNDTKAMRQERILNNQHNKMGELIKMAKDSFQPAAANCKPSSTEMLFLFLSKRIEDANLPIDVVLKIEQQCMEIVQQAIIKNS